MSLSEKKKIANERYLAKLKPIMLRAYPDEAERIKAAAAAAGQSTQRYILDACRERMQRDAAQSATDSDA